MTQKKDAKEKRFLKFVLQMRDSCANDLNFTKDCLDAVLKCVLHSILFVRALGVCAVRELSLLSYPCPSLSSSGSVLTFDTQDFDDFLTVATVDDAEIHARISFVMKRAIKSLLSDYRLLQESAKEHLVEKIESSVLIEIEFGITDSAARNALKGKRRERREQRFQSILKSDENEEGRKDKEKEEEEQGGILSALNKFASGLWKSKSVNDSTSFSTGSTESDSKKYKSRSMEKFPGERRERGKDGEEEKWKEMIRLESAFIENIAFGVDAPKSAILTKQEFYCLKSILVKEICKRHVEDDQMCRNVWERWKVEIVLTEGADGVRKRATAKKSDDLEDSDRILIKEEERKEGMDCETKALLAHQVRLDCAEILSSILSESQDSGQNDEMPTLSQYAAQKPLCWPVCFRICRKAF